MKYRREIDGLRALAVVPVILFHFGFTLFGGGFVGVDVFFVISGYLITSIIASEIGAGKFSIIDFYERRARRILPALFAVMFACLVLAWIFLLPQDMREFSGSLVATSLFYSNIMFWMTSGYFDSAAEMKPLLHTWSLAIEEQYYLLFPPFLMLFWRRGEKVVLSMLVSMVVLSLGAAQWASIHKPTAAFYLLPTRTWELLIGSLVAFHCLRENSRVLPVMARQVLSAAGVCLILSAVFIFDGKTPFPGLYALVPTVGAALVILFASPQTLAGKVLGSRVLVGIGLISFSLYLWHQPLLAFARHGSSHEPGSALRFLLLMLVVVLSVLTWRYVETPFRDRATVRSAHVFGFAAAGCLFFCLVGLLGATVGVRTLWGIRNPGLVNEPAAIAAPLARACPGLVERHGDMTCRVIGHGPRRVVLWGDSHALVLARGVFPVEGVEYHVLHHAGCPPVIGVKRFDGFGNSANCDQLSILKNYAEYIAALSPEAVIMAGRWMLYVNGWREGGALKDAHHLLSDLDAPRLLATPGERRDLLQKKMLETVGFFSGSTRVFLLMQPPEMTPAVFRRAQRSDLATPLEEVMKLHRDEYELFKAFDGLAGVRVIDSKAALCDRETCRTRAQGVLLYSDNNHLSDAGVALVWDLVLREMAGN